MYAKPLEIEDYLKGDARKPFISCEYMHAMGNSCGGMYLYTELEKHLKYQGGFIWDFIDQAILTKDRTGREALCYGGDFDDRATDYNFCADGIVYANREPSPKVQEVKFLYQNIKLIPDKTGVLIKNQNLFSDTEDFYVQYELLRNGNPIFSSEAECPVAAGKEKYFELPLPAISQGGEYALSCSLRHKKSCLWAEQDFEQAFGQYVWTVAGESEPAAPELPLTVVHGDVNIGVYGGGFSVLFSLQEGGMVSLRKNGTEFVTRPPKPIYWRAATDNDRGNGYPFRTAVWNTAGMFQKCRNVSVDETNGLVTVTYEYELPMPVSAIVTVSYTVRPNGSILVKADYPGVQNMPELPLFGLGLQLKSQYCNFTYYGMGPDENYCDRVRGARLGIFKGTAQKNLSRYIVPQECGNRTGVRWAKVTDDTGTGLCFTACKTPFEFGLLPFTAYEIENALHREELPPPRYTEVRIMSKQMGVGGDDSWGAPIHEEFMIPSDQPLSLTFTIDICS
jgi:beta-galactosidase